MRTLTDRALRIAAAPVLLLVGAATAVATVVAHELWWGLPLAAAALLASFVWIGRGWLTRLPLALGFVAVVLLAVSTRPEGDYLIASSAPGYLLLLLALVVLVAAVVTLPRPRSADSSVSRVPSTWVARPTMTRVTEQRGREKPGGRVVVLLLLGLALLAGGAYAAAYLAAGDRVPRGTTVAGVEIGGMTPDEAIEELETELADRADRADPGRGRRRGGPAPARGGRAARSTTPPRWRRPAVASPGNPPGCGTTTPAATSCPPPSTSTRTRWPRRSTSSPPRSAPRPVTAAWTSEGSRVVVEDSRTGEALDTEAARDEIESSYLSDGDPAAVELTLTSAEPDIDDGDVQEALDDFANPAVSGPVTLLFGDSRIRLSPRDYADALAAEAARRRAGPRPRPRRAHPAARLPDQQR